MIAGGCVLFLGAWSWKDCNNVVLVHEISSTIVLRRPGQGDKSASANNGIRGLQESGISPLCPIGRELIENFTIAPYLNELSEVSYMAHSRQRYKGSDVLWYVIILIVWKSCQACCT
jgi:hypothetical protein